MLKSVLVLAFATSAAIGFCQATQRTLFVPNNTAGTVTSFTVNPDGTLSSNGVFAAGPNPYDCTVTPDGRNLIVINTSNQTSEEVVTFLINADGTLTRQFPSRFIGDGTLSIAMTSTGYALITQATEDTLISMDVIGDNTVQVGAAPAGPFPVEVIASPNGNLAFVSGTQGSGYIYTFTVAANGTLTAVGQPGGVTGVGTGQGLAIHPTLPIVYQSTGLGNTVFWYSYSNAGVLTPVSSIATAGNSCVEMTTSPDGNWLYICNVVSDTLTVHPILPNGNLGASQYSFTIGNDIRDVVADGTFVYVTDESSINSSPVGVQVFKVEANGSLTAIGSAVPTGGTRPSHMAVWVPAAVGFSPSSFSVSLGTLLGGGLADLLTSDDQKVFVLSDEFNTDSSVEISAYCPVLQPTLLRLKVEASASRDNLVMGVYLRDHAASVDENIAFFALTQSDAEHVSEITSNIDRFLTPATARIDMKLTSFPTESYLDAPDWVTAYDRVRFEAR